MKKIIRTLLIMTGAVVATSLSSSQAATILQPLATFGTNGDGSLRPGDIPYLTTTNQLQRGLAYNPTTGHLLLVDRSANSSANCDVWVLDATTGAVLNKLDNGSVYPGGTTGFSLNMIGIADDGAIYVANLTSGTTTTPQVRLYRWSDESAAQALVVPAGSPTDPAQDPSGGSTVSTQKRWGDNMVVRGAGLNTQILFVNRGTLAAIYTPDDASYSHFTPRTLSTDVSTGDLGWGLSFGSGDTFWATSGANGNGPMLHLSFDTTAGTATTIGSLTSSNFATTISPFLVMPSSNLLAGITMLSGADVVRLYDISNPSAPVLLDRKSFSTANNNANFVGSVTLGTNGVLYTLDSDNGILALSLTTAESNPLPPAFYLQPAGALVGVGASVSLIAAADSSVPISYQWMLYGTNLVPDGTNATLTFNPAQITNSGQYSLIASNSLGSVTSSVVTLTVAATPPTTLFGYEPFNYTSGQLLTAASTNWTLNGSGNDSYVAPFGLSIPGLASSIGNSVTNGGSGAGLRYTFGATNVSGEVYYSFAMRIDSIGASFTSASSFIAALVDPAGSSTYVCRLSPRVSTNTPGTYNLGVSKVNSTIQWATNDFTEGQVLFIVGRYTFNSTATTDDQADLWINPSSASFGAASPPEPTATAEGGNDINLISQFTFRQNSSANTPAAITYDELRVGKTWADVTPQPAAPKPSLTVARNGDGTATLSWPSSATGYNLESTANLSAPSWASVTNSIVVSGTNNTVTVNAISGNQFFRLKK